MKEAERNVIKSKSRLAINLTLLGVCFSIFTFIIALKPDLLRENLLLSAQLTLAIPFIITSIFARTTLGYTKKPKIWNKYGFITFLFAYGFLINVVGVLLSSLVSVRIGILFFIANIILALSYSYMEIKGDNYKIKRRIKKDLIFISILLFGGILPSLGVY
tara:strand:- start:426 stop:908 length:483 start_codon:yes stop_codon:yes gene_type:complete